MNKMYKNNKGFTAVEGLLIILILVVMGGVGYMVYHKTKTVTASITKFRPSTASSTKSTAASNPYAGWKTYSASIEPISFKYPSNWTIATGEDAPVKTSSHEAIVINAPLSIIDGVKYQFSMNFQIYTPEGGFVNESPVYSSQKIMDANFSKPLYALITELSSSNAPANNAGDTDNIEVSTTNYSAGSNTDNNDDIPTLTSGREIDFGGSYVTANNNTVAYFTPSQFASLPEVKQSAQIFATLSDK